MTQYELLEIQDMLRLLEAHGHGEFVEKMLAGEKCFTKSTGRINRCGAARHLGITLKELNLILEDCRDILGDSH